MTTPAATRQRVDTAGLRRSVELFIAFVDLAGYWTQSQRSSDEEQAETLDAFYALVVRTIENAGGTVVKFIGDAALIVFAQSDADDAIRALVALRASVDQLMSSRGWECRLGAKAHVGSAIVGSFGPPAHERFDVIGRAIGETARLRGAANTITLSPAAYAASSDAAHRGFVRNEATNTWTLS